MQESVLSATAELTAANSRDTEARSKLGVICMDTKLSSEFADDEAVPFTKLLDPLRGYEK